MPLAEQMREKLPAKERIHMLSTVARQGVEFVKRRIERHGIFGEVFVWMVIFSGLRLLWSPKFPPGWWVVLVLVLAYNALHDKFVWPAQIHEEKIEAEKVKAHQASLVSNTQNGSTLGA